MANIVVYTSTPCGYCTRAKALLDQKGVDYHEIHLSRTDVDARMDLVKRTGRYTVPQILVNDHSIGGYDELAALERAGHLDQLLAA